MVFSLFFFLLDILFLPLWVCFWSDFGLPFFSHFAGFSSVSILHGVFLPEVLSFRVWVPLRSMVRLTVQCFIKLVSVWSYSPMTQPSSLEIFMSPHSCFATHSSQGHQLFQLSFSYMSASLQNYSKRSFSIQSKVLSSHNR